VVSQKTSAQLKGQPPPHHLSEKTKHYIGEKKMFIANKDFISTETKMILQKSQNSLINLYMTMERANIVEIEAAGQVVEKQEVLKGAELVGRILDVCV
jgi:hypothetical protein